jgi:hypothetical protein
MALCPFRCALASDLAQGPAWANSFRDCKSLVEAMVADGEIERVAPSGASYRNMIALTQAGARRYFGKAVGVYFVLSRADERDVIAEVIAEGGSLADAARRLAMPYPTAKKRWNEIRASLGGQAA